MSDEKTTVPTDDELEAADLDAVSGGLNPQPLPPDKIENIGSQSGGAGAGKRAF